MQYSQTNRTESYFAQEEHRRTPQEHNQSPRRYTSIILCVHFHFHGSKSQARPDFRYDPSRFPKYFLEFYTFFNTYFILNSYLSQDRTQNRLFTYSKKKHANILWQQNKFDAKDEPYKNTTQDTQEHLSHHGDHPRSFQRVPPRFYHTHTTLLHKQHLDIRTLPRRPNYPRRQPYRLHPDTREPRRRHQQRLRYSRCTPHPPSQHRKSQYTPSTTSLLPQLHY